MDERERKRTEEESEVEAHYVRKGRVGDDQPSEDVERGKKRSGEDDEPDVEAHYRPNR